MTPEEVQKYYRTAYHFESITNMSETSFYNWMKRGCIPIGSQLKIEGFTNGELKANVEHAVKK